MKLAFLIYDTRSGSTLLSRLLNEYSDTLVTVESDFIISILRLRNKINDEMDVGCFFDEISGVGRFGHLEIDKKEFLKMFCSMPKTAYSLVVCILSLYLERVKPKAQVCIVKDGANGYYLKQIISEIPSAQFIHIFRDGRAVLNSRMKTKRPYGKGESMSRDPLTSARLWCDLIKRIDQFALEFPTQILQIQYESLINETDKGISTIRNFLGLNAELPKKRLKEGNYFESIPEKEKNIHKLVSASPAQSRCNAWEKELALSDRKLFEYKAARILEKKGYGDIIYSNKKDLLDPDMISSLFLSYAKRGKSWLSYIVNPKLLKKIIALRLLKIKEDRFKV